MTFRILLALGGALIAAGPAAAAPAEPAPPQQAPAPVESWMIGRFFGTNEGMDGHIVELQISATGHTIAVVDGREAFHGEIQGDRLYVDQFEFIVTQTSEGLKTTQVENETNVVFYTRM